MPGVVPDPGLGQRLVEPSPVIVLRIAPGVPKHVHRLSAICSCPFLSGLVALLRLSPLLLGAARNCIERNVARLSCFRFGQGDQAALKGYIPPFQLELFSRPHSGVNGNHECLDVLKPILVEDS